MKKKGEHTLNEIVSQPRAWEQALDKIAAHKDEILDIWDKLSKTRVLFTGCGSTYYLSLAAASLFQELTGRGARAIPAGELILNPDATYESGLPAILVAISRSGTTTETVATAEKFKEAGRGPVIAITNYSDTPLATAAELAITISAGQEESVAQTRSFASMYVAATALAAMISERDDLLSAMEALPKLGANLLKQYNEIARSMGENLRLDRFYFLGSGSRYGLACETNLKMKEMTLTHSEPFHFLEFRHGPMSMVTNTTAIVGMRSSMNSNHEQKVLDEMQSLGAHIFTLAESNADVAFNSGLPEEIRNVLYLPVLQLMAYYRSLAKGLNPDKPNNLTAVVQLDLM